MTVASTENREVYNGNGVTVAFAFAHKFFANADLKVYVDDVLLTLTTNYTVSGAGDEAGGTVTFLVAPPAGTGNVVILRDPAVTQERDFVENDPLPVEEVENALDLLTMLIQRLKELQGRSLTLDDSDADASLQLPLLADRADKVLGFDSLGDLIATVDISDLGTLNANVTAILAMFQNMSSLNFNALNFSTTPTVGNAVARLIWNDTDGTLNLGLKGGTSVLQVGQETMARVLNNTGSTITNGSVVRITGSQGNRVTVALAQANSAANTTGILGIATEDIANNTEGFVTAIGHVRDIDTSAFNEGDTLYLSATTPGALTATAPSLRVEMAVVERNHVTQGRIFVRPVVYDPTLARLGIAQDFTAPQRSTPLTDNDLSFDLAAKQNFTATPTAGGTLTFTGLAAGLNGNILLVNGSNYAIAKAANVKCNSSFLTTVSATGTYWISYYSDGTNVYVSTAGATS